MNKRKPPFALVSILLVLLGVAFVFANRVFQDMNFNPEEEMRKQMEEEMANKKGGQGTVESAEDLAKVSKSQAPVLAPREQGEPSAAGPKRSVILVPEMPKPHKPKADNSSVRSLRYTSDGNK
jgi:hypothetical protein